MQKQQTEVARLQKDLASGRRLHVAADDPAAAERVLRADHQVHRLEQFQRALDQARTSMEHQDQALGGMVNLVHRTREIAIQAENDTVTVKERQILAMELGAIASDLRTLANARDGEGNYLFAGFKTDREPFSKAGDGNIAYQGDNGQRHLQTADGSTLIVNQSGRELFEGIMAGNGEFSVASNPGNTGTGIVVDGGVADRSMYQSGTFEIRFTAVNVFDVVDTATGGVVLGGQSFVEGADIAFNGVKVSIRGEPQAGDVFSVESGKQISVFSMIESLGAVLELPGASTADGARLSQGIAGALQDMDQVLERLGQGRGSLGARLRSVDQQASIHEATTVGAKELLSELRDLDYAEATTRLNQHLLGLQAAQQTFTRLQGLSLFDLMRR